MPDQWPYVPQLPVPPRRVRRPWSLPVAAAVVAGGLALLVLGFWQALTAPLLPGLALLVLGVCRGVGTIRHGRAERPAWTPGVLVVACWVLVLVVAPLAGTLGDHPWLRWWWPGVRAATTLPEPCPLVARALSRRWAGDSRLRPSIHDTDRQKYCGWGRRDELGLSLEYGLYRSGTRSGADYVREDLDGYASDPAWRSVPGLGDACLVSTIAITDGGRRTTVRARRVNVRVIVTLWDRRSGNTDSTRSAAVRLARHAVHAVELS